MGSSNTKAKEKSRFVKPRTCATINPADKVMLQLKLTRDDLMASISRYERVRAIEHSKAKSFLLNGDKRHALYCLKREKSQQSQIETVQGMLNNIQTLIDTVDFANVEHEVVETLQVGKSELQRLNKMLNIDDIERLMSDTAETLAEADEINSIIRTPIPGVEQDNDTLLQELEGIIGYDPLRCVEVPNHPLPSQNVTLENTMSLNNKQSTNKLNANNESRSVKVRKENDSDENDISDNNLTDEDKVRVAA